MSNLIEVQIKELTVTINKLKGVRKALKSVVPAKAEPVRETPCTGLGYSVGDVFIYSSEHRGVFSNGAVVELYEDDDSQCPLFKLLKGSCLYNNAGKEPGAYTDLEHVTKISS